MTHLGKLRDRGPRLFRRRSAEIRAVHALLGWAAMSFSTIGVLALISVTL